MSTAVANLDNDGVQVNTEKDNVIIQKVLETVRGGRTLETTGWPFDVLSSGLCLIEEIATKIVKPMPLNSGKTAYAALPAGYRYFAIQIQSVLTKKPFVGCLKRGAVNEVAAPYAFTTDMKTAFNLITFNAD